MAKYFVSLVLCLLVCVVICIAQLTSDKDLLLNWCLNSTLHKEKPGKESTLHQQCLPWKDHSCCTHDTSKKIHGEDMHNFDLNHCREQTGKDLSPDCRKHFDRDNCFYECEPNIGLWVVQTKRKIATERFINVPLCAADCDDWWNDCKDDYTCAYNWPRNFKFRNGVNYCLEGTCQTFQSVYGDAKSFCENVWDGSWKYTNNSEPCMRMWFNGTVGNPNRNTAEYYIKLKFGSASSISANFLMCIISMAVALRIGNLIS